MCFNDHIKRRVLNGKKSFFICKNSVKVQNSYNVVRKIFYFTHHIVEKGF